LINGLGNIARITPGPRFTKAPFVLLKDSLIFERNKCNKIGLLARCATIMKKFLISIILFLILSCKSDKKDLPSEFKDTEQHFIEFLEREIRLPNEYEKNTIEQMFFIRESYDNPDGFVELQYKRLNSLQNSGAEFKIFTEKGDFINTISFMLGKYIPLDKSVVNRYVNILEQQILPESTEFGFEYKRLESKFITLKNTKIIKVKYEQTNQGKKLFMTQYLITYRYKTFSMIIINKKDIDFQYLLKNFVS